MEAASARYAARDRFGGFMEPAQTPLQRQIQNAVDPQNYEPNLALNLEVADLINAKKGNAPREAAVAIVNFVNHRNPNVSLLSLALLDICVKNCGYPFHLQISTKEFLNELVRRFPERPPARASRVQMRVLELIEDWRQTICQTSRYKEDLGFVRDMHRLLSVKGYVFPAVKREDAAVLNRSENLQSADEMEEEERAAQSAKLQELIRRGGPQDLQEANRLMKIMAGYDTRHKVDYRAKAAEEVGKVQSKARLLEERLQLFKPGDKMVDGDVFEELASALKSAHPKIQRMCEEEFDDAEAIAKLLEINDSINRTIERYELMRKGNFDAAIQIPKGTLGTSTGVTKTADNELSLIDFEPESSPTTVSDSVGPRNLLSVENDLLSLSVQDHNYGQSGSISLGMAGTPSISANGLAQQSMARSTFSPSPSHQTNQGLESLKSVQPIAHSPISTSAISSISPLQSTSSQRVISSDPFATLNKLNAYTITPLPAPQSNPTPKLPFTFQANLSDKAKSLPNPTLEQKYNGTVTEDDWDFASALPVDEQIPRTNSIIVSDTTVKVRFHMSRPDGEDSSINIKALFSNNTAMQVTELTFQVAVTKKFTLRLTPQSGRILHASQQDGIVQPISLGGVAKGQTDQVKMRWKLSYKLGGQPRQEQGEVPPLGVL